MNSATSLKDTAGAVEDEAKTEGYESFDRLIDSITRVFKERDQFKA